MAFANSSISDIVATTIQARSKELADNVTNNIAGLAYMKKRGNVRPFNGGNVILEEIAYNDATTTNAGWYSGYDAINITPNSPISAAQYDIKQASSAVTISGLEELQNAGEERMIDLLEGRIMVAEAQLMNLISTGFYSDGTGSGGKQITGLQAAVADAPSTGTYGGINRANFSFWRNISFDATTDGGAAATSANIQSYMNRTILQTVRGTDSPDVALCDANYYRLYLESLQAIQRITTEGASTVGSGFNALKYYGAGKSVDVILDGGIGGSCPTNHMYFLNTKFLFWRPHKARNCVPLNPDRFSVNQDAMTKLIGFAGNLTSSGPQFQAVLKD